jgi:predicted amidophosphoribosyltransferase
VNICPSCGHENEAGAKFCSQCGLALADARQADRVERKIVTVVFAGTAALAFYRSVGATRYIREGEALLAASA